MVLSGKRERATCWNSVLRQCEKVVNAEIFEKVPEKPTKVWAGFGILRTWSEDQCVDCGLAGSPVAWLFGISDAEDVPLCRKKM